MQVLFRADLVYETLYNPGAARRGGRRGRRALGDGAIRGGGGRKDEDISGEESEQPSSEGVYQRERAPLKG